VIYGPEAITLRRLEGLVNGLPLESRTARELGAPKPGGWGNLEELLAGVIDELRISSYYFVKAHSKKGAIVPEPKMVRRPSELTGEDKPKPLKGEALVAALAKKGIGRVRYTPKDA